MKPTRAVEVVLEAALNDMREACAPLRRSGWPANITVEAAETYQDHFFDVVVRVRIGSPCLIPDEAREA